MDLRAAMTAFAITLTLGGCNETLLPPTEKAAVPPAEVVPVPAVADASPSPVNDRAILSGLNLTSPAFSASPRKFDEARAFVRRAWGEDCKPGGVSEVIAGGTESASWRVDCAGGEISTSSGGASPDYILEIPNEPDRPVIVNQCARRDGGALRCDTTGRQRT
jgi:hypothetical protein